MLVGVRQVQAMFKAAHRAIGKPTLAIIPPVSQWTLPTGVSYDAYRDQFINGSGAVVAVDWAIQPTTDLPYLPDRVATGLSFGVAGITTEQTTNVVCLWSTAAESALRAAWGVSLAGQLYRLERIERAPEGVTPAYLLQVSLKQGVQEQ